MDYLGEDGVGVVDGLVLLHINCSIIAIAKEDLIIVEGDYNSGLGLVAREKITIVKVEVIFEVIIKRKVYFVDQSILLICHYIIAFGIISVHLSLVEVCGVLDFELIVFIGNRDLLRGIR